MNGVFLASSSPHIRHIDTTTGIMLDVIIALFPATVAGFFLFGWYAVAVVGVCIAAAVASEFIWNLILKKEQSIGDLSAVVTGLLLGLNLPPAIPLWMAAIGSAIAIIVVKQMFGGIGHNFANPAITARIILLVSFPTAMTTFSEPMTNAISSATPLAGGESALRQLFFGMHSGCIGETSAFALLIGCAYLLIRRVINPIIPFTFISSVALLSLISGGNVTQSILGGGLMIGAIFMATDYTTSPITNLGKLIFGIGCGILTFVIRRFGSLPEGVSYSILLMNILVPHINRLTLLKPFGAKEAENNE